MSNIKTQLHEESIPLYSIRLIEFQRIFDLIQENIPDPKAALTVRNIECFMEKFYIADSQQKAQKLMFELNRDGLEMNSEKFASSMAKYLSSVQLTNERSLGQLYRRAKEVLSLTYKKPIQQCEIWDIDQEMSQQALKDRQNNIEIFYNEMHPFIDGMEVYQFQSYLEKLNYCLSVISISNVESYIFKFYKTFINSTIINHISEFLATISQIQLNPQQLNDQLIQSICSQQNNVTNYFALITHFYTACKYRQLKEKLESNPCLFYQEAYKAIILALKIPDVKIQRQVAICLCMMSKWNQNFNEWVLSDINPILMPLLATASSVKDEAVAYYSLICLKNIVKRYQRKPASFREAKNNQIMMQKIHTFSMYLLGTFSNNQLQKQCFLLLAQILKACPINFKQIQELKVITKAFELQIDYQVVLMPAVLTILEVSIHKKLDLITNMIINDPGFLACLQTHFGSKQSVFFFHFLHIVYLLSYNHTTFLLQKGLLEKTVVLMFSEANSTVVSIGSDILLNAVQQALDNEQILSVLYDKLQISDKVLPQLFKMVFVKLQYLDGFMMANNLLPMYSYFDKYILNNFFKIMYSLAVGVNRKHKKYGFVRVFFYLFQRVTEEVINSISKILDDLFSSGDKSLIEIVMREKIKIVSNKIKLQNGIPLFKMITMILQEMTYNVQNRSLQILKTIDHQVKSFGQNLLKSQVFTLHELQVQKIPLYIKIDIEYDNARFGRSIPYKFQLSALKAYIKTLIIKGTDYKANDVKDVILSYKENGRTIENDVQYKALVAKALENKVTTLAWFVKDVKWRSRRREDIMVSSFVIPNYEPVRSSREPNTFANSRFTASSRQMPNYGANRYNHTTRENMEDSYGRRSYSPIRARSPAFGGSGGNRNR